MNALNWFVTASGQGAARCSVRRTNWRLKQSASEMTYEEEMQEYLPGFLRYQGTPLPAGVVSAW